MTQYKPIHCSKNNTPLVRLFVNDHLFLHHLKLYLQRPTGEPKKKNGLLSGESGENAEPSLGTPVFYGFFQDLRNIFGRHKNHHFGTPPPPLLRDTRFRYFP